MRRQLSLIAVAAASLALAGCGSSGSTPAAGSSGAAATTTSAAPITGTVVVSAAASLKETFTTLAGRFTKAHPGVKVTLNFGGSDLLASQITSGSPVDVFAAASTKTMAVVTDAKAAIGTPVVFARNKLEIATPPGNPAKIASLADTTTSGVKLVLCEATVPCGAAAIKAYDAATLVPRPVSLEPDVKSVLTKVELKEADAGMVYQTDVKAAGAKVLGVAFPEADQAIATYPIVGITGGENPTAGAAFIAAVLSSAGSTVLQAAGFLAP